MADNDFEFYAPRKRKNRKKKNKTQCYTDSTPVTPDSTSNNEIEFNKEESINNDISELSDDTNTEVNETPVENREIIDPSGVQFVDNTDIATDAHVVLPMNEEKDKQYEEFSEEENSEQVVNNPRVLSKEATTYELEKFEKHAMVIFNQENIDGYEPRFGTQRDVEALSETFEDLGFEVKEHKNLTRNEIFKALKEFSQRDFTDYGCICVTVLTHGSRDGFIRAKDVEYNEQEILAFFKVHNKPTLITKPKLLIIQACRGTRVSEGVSVQQGRILTDVDQDVVHYYLPVEADMLVFHSSFVGGVSYRHEKEGSWFIQTLCKYIKQYSETHHAESIFTMVKKEVAIEKSTEEFNRRTLRLAVNKQMPVMTSTLIRKLYFKKFERKEDVCELRTLKDSSNSIEEISCLCFLSHYNYLRNCLRNYSEENPNDRIARSFLELSDTYEDTPHFMRSKEKMAAEICKHLQENTRSYPFYKYLYFYKHF